MTIKLPFFILKGSLGRLEPKLCFMPKKLSFILLFIGLSLTGISQSAPQFDAILPDTVAPGQTFKISFVLKNGDGDDFQAPEITGLTLVGGPNTSSSFSFMNGVSSQSVTFEYFYQAHESGTISIPPATIQVSNEILKTDWGKIAIVEGYVNRKAQQRSRSPFGSWFDSDWPQAIPEDRAMERPRRPRKEQRKVPNRKRKVYRI